MAGATSLDDTLAVAAELARPWAAAPVPRRAAALRAIAAALRADAEDLTATATAETALGTTRLSEEIERAAVGAELLADGLPEAQAVRVDPADRDRACGAHSELRRQAVAVGPVLNFAASNFPFTFSVAGGDTLAALAAGCPVVVKAHPGHPRTSEQSRRVIAEALRSVGADPRLVQVVHGQDEGVTALKDPRIRAATFTGSLRVGRLLADIAASRPEPIPFFGELGSVNPVFVLPGKAREATQAIAEQLVSLVSWSVGQVCTKPGFVFIPRDSGIPATIAGLEVNGGEARLLHPGITAGYAERLELLRGSQKVSTVREGSLRRDDEGQGWVTTSVFITSIDKLESDPTIFEETFGPSTVLVEYGSVEQLLAFVRSTMRGSLTAALLFSDNDEQSVVRELAAELQHHVGRLAFNRWTPELSISAIQHHGGPWPAATVDSRNATSVGPMGIDRFLRTVVWQNAPAFVLPS